MLDVVCVDLFEGFEVNIFDLLGLFLLLCQAQRSREEGRDRVAKVEELQLVFNIVVSHHEHLVSDIQRVSVDVALVD